MCLRLKMAFFKGPSSGLVGKCNSLMAIWQLRECTRLLIAVQEEKKNVISAFAKAIPKDLLQHCFILQLQFRTFEFDGFFLSRKRNGLSLLLFYCSASNDHLWQYFTFVSDKIASIRPDPSIYKIFSKRTFSLASLRTSQVTRPTIK